MEKLNRLLLLSVITITGCSLYETQPVVIDNTTTVVVNNADLASKIKLSLKDAPKEDCIKAYKFLKGLSCYIRNVNNDNLTTDEILNKTLLKVQMDYGWNRDKYPNLTVAISEDLVSKKLDDPHKLGDITEQGKICDVLANSLDEYANSIKTLVESK